MGFLRNIRDRFLPPSNRAYRRLTKATNSEVAALRSQVELLSDKVDALASELKDTNAQVKPMASGIKRLERAHAQANGEILSTLDYLSLATTRQGKDTGAILLAGWYCAGNSGDDLMLKTLVGYAPASLRDDIYVLAWNNNPSFDPEPLNDLGVHVVRYPTTTREADPIASCFDVLVWGGGAILDDAQYDSRPNNCNTGNLFIRLSEIMIARKKPVYAVGLSANDSFSSREYLERLQHVIDGSRAFTLRDQVSFDALRDAGIQMDKVGRCEDIAFASPALLGAGDRSRHDASSIGFVPFYIPEMHEVNVAVLDDILGVVGDDPQTRVTLIPFYAKGDAAYLPKLQKACCDPGRVEIAPFADDVTRSPIYGCSHLVVSRYHAALMASVASIPHICMIPDMHRHYNNKMRHLASLCGYEDHYVAASAWGDAQSGTSLLAALLQEETGPQVPGQVLADTHRMLEDLWGDVEARRNA